MKLSKRIFVFCLLLELSFSFPVGLCQTNNALDNQAKIGIFYYVWWDTTSSNSWDDTCVDIPVLSSYNSYDSTIISQHLTMIEELGIDFVIISWWGTEDGFGRFTDMSAKQVFQIANSSQTSLKFAILVEPFDTENKTYDHAAIYDQIYTDFFLPYSTLYYCEDGNPLICFYNDPGNAPSLTDCECMPLDARFTCKIVGEEPYTHWMYLDLVRPVFREKEVSVTPRYDESRLADRSMGIQIDPRLDEGVYDQEWEKAIQLWQLGQVETILISSWNEFYERTAIEPHFDATAVDPNPYFLYAKTEYYIAELRQSTLVPTEELSSTPSLTVTSSAQTLSMSIIPEYPSAQLIFALLIAFTTVILAFKNSYRE